MFILLGFLYGNTYDTTLFLENLQIKLDNRIILI
jgi:hypothetical protein